MEKPKYKFEPLTKTDVGSTVVLKHTLFFEPDESNFMTCSTFDSKGISCDCYYRNAITGAVESTTIAIFALVKVVSHEANT